MKHVQTKDRKTVGHIVNIPICFTHIYMIIPNTCMLYTLSLQIHQKHVFFSSYKHFSLYKRVDGNRKIKNWKTRRITLDLLLSIINILYGFTGNSQYSYIKWRNQIRRQTNWNYSSFFICESYWDTKLIHICNESYKAELSI